VALLLAALTVFVAFSVQKVLNDVPLLYAGIDKQLKIQQNSRNFHQPRTHRHRGVTDQERRQGHHIIIDN
jgi:hypothetical protein